MTIKGAIKILEDHNNWRRGKIEENPHTPKEIGKAIDLIIEYIKKDIILIDFELN